MQADEIRRKFLDFFKDRGHLESPSAPLAVEDPELLFTIAGMVPFKAFFLGIKSPPSSRITSCQLCFRTNDLDRVGQTSYHHTFFEMLGNFSFGDYFKNEACEWALQFITKELDINYNKLWVTVFKEDEETASIWKKLGIPPSKIVKKGEEDNFWSAADVGPCGPDTEIFFDRGEDLGCEGGCEPGCNKCSRWVEMWNLVFMQYTRDSSGKLSPLPSKNVDTGMGLERMATILQKVNDDYHTDLFLPIYNWVKEISSVPECEEKALRVISDHLRGLVFLLEEGILPSNTGRGYVVRRVLRRAFRYGKRLGINEPFLYRGVDVVIQIMGRAYPKIKDKKERIKSIIKLEEENFQRTLSRGLSILEQMIGDLKNKGERILPGQKAFKMYDTFGFPIDLTREIALDSGLSVDEDGFQQLMEKQRKKARETLILKSTSYYDPSFLKKVEDKCVEKGGTFVGYEKLCTEATLLCIIKDKMLVKQIEEEEEGEIILSETPFYPEGGGQIGDRGDISSLSGIGKVVDTYRRGNLIFHRVKLLKGKLKEGERVKARVDEKRRWAISRSHTATHLLHAALRNILGDEVKQSGSLVEEDRLRFDFTFSSPIDDEKLKEVIFLINEKIREDIPVKTEKTSLEEARKKGAIALFEEKYGEKVRVVQIGDFSKEVCGGTHLLRTGQMGLFQILSEGSIASGVRRIEAFCGEKALLWVMGKADKLKKLTQLLEVPEEKIFERLQDKEQQIIKLQNKLKSLQEKLVESKIQRVISQAVKVGTINVCTGEMEDISPELLRKAAENIRDSLKEAVVVLSSLTNRKAFLVVASSRKDLPANELIKKISSITGGSGGGRWDFAQGGTSHPDKVSRAFQQFPEIVRTMIKK